MDPITRDLLKVVRPELGYREKAGQRTKYGEWYAKHVGRDPQYKNGAWCDMFIAWAAHKAGVSEYVGTFAWTPSHARWFERQGAWSDRPEPGALVFFDWGGSKDIKKIDHVGIVERVKGDRIHTIEANVDRVWVKRKVRDQSKVVGYGLPRKVKENLERAARTAEPGPEASIRARDEPGFEFFGAPIETLPVTALVVVVTAVAVTAYRLRVRRASRQAARAAQQAAQQVAQQVAQNAAQKTKGPVRGRHRRTGRRREPDVRWPSGDVFAGPAPSEQDLPPGPDRDAGRGAHRLTRTG